MMDLQLLLGQLAGLAGLTLLHGTVLAFVTWSLCANVLRKARPALHGALWTIVLLKFLVPPIFPGELGLSGWLQRGASSWVSGWWSGGATGGIESVVPGQFLSPQALATAATNSSAALWTGSTFLYFAFGVYLILLAGILVRSGVKSVRLWKKVRRLPLAPENLQKEVERLSKGVGVIRAPKVRTTPGSSSPFVMGFWMVNLVIPDRLFATLKPESREALIVHELAHIRRGDLLIRGLQNMARIVLFFWPPVWWVCRRIERCAEMACDQWAVSVSSVHPSLYARSLLEVVRGLANPQVGGQELAFARRGRVLEERFEMILKRDGRVSPKLSWLMIPALAVWVSFALAGGGPSQPGEGEEGKKVVKKKMVVKVEGDSGILPAEILERHPEADANSDGELTIEEFKEFLEEHKDEMEGNIFIMKAHGEELHFGTEEHAVVHIGEDVSMSSEVILEKHPEADANEDGELSKEELHAFIKENHGGKVMVQRIELGEGEDGKVWVHEGHEGHKGQKITIQMDEAHLEHLGEGENRHVRVFVGEPDAAVILEKHPEADTNGDGELSDEELGEFKMSLHASGNNVVFIGEGLHEAHEEGDMAHYSWTAEDGAQFEIKVSGDAVAKMDLDGDGEVSLEEAKAFAHSEEGKQGHGHKEIRIDVRKIVGEDELHEISESEASADRVEMAEKRRAQLLKKYPKADLDGDGVLSSDEAKALAAKIQKDAAKEKKQPN
jgi:beta-lactamase regulating signal transducer with metallopeptidase domain